jgi:dCTP deaminase
MNEDGILSGRAIERAVKRGAIRIDPFNPKHLNPASYDVSLGHEVMCYKKGETLDPKKLNPTEGVHKIPKEGLVLQLGAGYLMHTREFIGTTEFVPVLDGKSSLGRLFLMVHCTAGFGDVGFCGQYTLEVTALIHPVILYPGMRIGQVRFHTIFGEVDLYKGHYQGTGALGAVASRSYQQFEEDGGKAPGDERAK